ncbi:hypothetical protein swp_1788 [Shewanella piezotolerans WP3]|uniref:Uncharacterized protein n=1 Tax=Shewanella piezotolerans (strain WP3 / JCM 13877) TaxID=225849 RepID=B8CN51_SHEPW|nr:hypothetical protein swp_1788 [Shewanella piezotolerans WP3]
MAPHKQPPCCVIVFVIYRIYIEIVSFSGAVPAKFIIDSLSIILDKVTLLQWLCYAKVNNESANRM